MKSAIKTVLILTLILFIGQVSNGQSFLDRMKQKANKKIEKRLEEKLDKAMDKQLDDIENSIDSLGAADGATETEDGIQSRLNNMMKGIGMSGEPVPIDDSYAFTELVQMHIESFDKSNKKTSEGDFITHLNPDAQSMAYEVVSGDIGENQQGLFIIDTKNKAIILLNDTEGEKTGIVYGMGGVFGDIGNQIAEEANDEEEDMPDNIFANPNVTKTGKTKTIAGYKCEQYTYNDEETESEFWITDELKTSSSDFFSALFKTSVYTNGMGWGYVMESASKYKNTGDATKMTVTKVDKNSHQNFKLSEYQITNLGTLNMPSGVDE